MMFRLAVLFLGIALSAAAIFWPRARSQRTTWANTYTSATNYTTTSLGFFRYAPGYSYEDTADTGISFYEGKATFLIHGRIVSQDDYEHVFPGHYRNAQVDRLLELSRIASQHGVEKKP